MAQPTVIAVICVFIQSHSFISGVQATTFTIVNKCDYVIWPGILSTARAPTISTMAFTLQSGETKTITAPTSWGGRFWGRTHCSQDSSGNFSCLTGDCGSRKLECSGNGASPPATLAEFTLDGAGGFDFFYVSLVDGYNVPMLVVPQGGTGQNCTYTGCVVDLNDLCPSELKVMSTDSSDGVACKSACEAFREPQYYCNGDCATPDTCKPSSYSEIIKRACPRAYSYACDDKTSTFTCANADYTITFCPANTRLNILHKPFQLLSNTFNDEGLQELGILLVVLYVFLKVYIFFGSSNYSHKLSQGQNKETTTRTTSPLINSTMVFQGALYDSAASPSTCNHVFGSHG